MDLDYKSVKALSSPTRLEILQMVLDEEATTTKLSEELGKSKSTISSHLKVLTDSGLLEKDEEQGRRRVVYRPKQKAEAIARGRERKVKFSVISSALTSLTGFYMLSRGFTSTLSYKGDQVGSRARNEALEQESAGTMGAMDAESDSLNAESADAVNQTAQNAAESGIQILQDINPETVLGIILILLTITTLAYAYIHLKLKEGKEE